MTSVPTFRATVWEFYRKNKRELPWRTETSPYNVVVSEIMLQQTQVSRVLPKFTAFCDVFSSWGELAAADTADLLRAWQGLGYNSRALRLRELAKVVVVSGLPKSEKELRALPGIGAYTASAILAFVYNEPVVMIETNIRRAFLHHFFPEQEGVSDKELLPFIEAALDESNPREWYWALMDYGSWLGLQYPNANKRSKSYAVQSKFKGSVREMRGIILRLMTEKGHMKKYELVSELHTDPRIEPALRGLLKEKVLKEEGESVLLV